MKMLYSMLFLLIATTFEVNGDALIRIGIYNHAGLARIGFFAIGIVLLFGYGFFLNLAPLEFGQVAGLYIATLFIVWQVVNFMTFKTLPSMPVLIGGALIVSGGLLVTFWNPPGTTSISH